MSYTKGPWRWEFNARHKSVHLVGGKPRFDLTVMDFARWGMGGAVPRFQDTSVDGINLLDRLCDKPDWIAPEVGREHHHQWHQLVTHPDARLMAAAPELLEALQAAIECGMVPSMSARSGGACVHVEQLKVADQIRDAIAKATGTNNGN